MLYVEMPSNMYTLHMTFPTPPLQVPSSLYVTKSSFMDQSEDEAEVVSPQID